MKVCELQENDGWYPMLLYGYRIRGLDNSYWGHVLVKNKKLIGKERKQMKKQEDGLKNIQIKLNIQMEKYVLIEL